MLGQKASFSIKSGAELCETNHTLADAPNIESLFVLNSLNYEVLTGDKAGLSSIRIDHKYRLLLKVEQKEEKIITVCNILDITNHYK